MRTAFVWFRCESCVASCQWLFSSRPPTIGGWLLRARAPRPLPPGRDTAPTRAPCPRVRARHAATTQALLWSPVTNWTQSDLPSPRARPLSPCRDTAHTRARRAPIPCVRAWQSGLVSYGTLHLSLRAALRANSVGPCQCSHVEQDVAL